jgi:hypothetical protein
VAREQVAAELRDLIASADVPPDELAMLIGNTFQRGRMEPGSREVLWGQSDDEIAIRLVYTKAGGFSAVLEDALSEDDASTLIKQIRVLEAGGDPVVWRTVLFAGLPVEGFFRYAERWQIRPVPPDAPRPPFLLAPHPFILEVRGKAVAEPFIGWMKGGKLLWEVQLILGLTLHGGLTAGNTSAHHEWVIDMTDIEAGAAARSVLGQVGYTLPTWPEPADDFSSVETLDSLREVSAAKYFSLLGIAGGQVLEIPDLLLPLLSAVDAADPTVRERFFRAAYWFSRSGPAWRLSRSLSYISLINAIEVLTPVAGMDACPACGLNRAPGPTARFRDTVERYAGDVPERKELYSLRSRLVHGDQILLSDGPSGWGFTPQSEEERWRHELASRIARVVIISWLFDAVASRGT